MTVEDFRQQREFSRKMVDKCFDVESVITRADSGDIFIITRYSTKRPTPNHPAYMLKHLEVHQFQQPE